MSDITFFNYSVPLLRPKQLNSAPVATPNSEGQPLVLEDEAEPGSDFYEFRAKSREPFFSLDNRTMLFWVGDSCPGGSGWRSARWQLSDRPERRVPSLV
ncbi:hypothetical protein [Laspinema olomoucense]|uniref:Uncharacterized protein n=1 Tax=Laspinema olomoucense D3b TaxID=2953688 RepID=A0ABT2N730_9CYAN|nr:hypothetical protein [Laspinema sp. D3b]MCT7977091.1 hypothetical protein [Laspinema sp. D3b]